MQTIVKLAVIFLLSMDLAAHAGATPYRLGPQDKLRVYVHEWPALTGEFVINASGNVALPMIGEVPAGGLQTSALAAAISERLQKKANLRGLPETLVEVSQYRPYYIVGGVERPGEYAYRPGMTVLTAVSIAGGMYRGRDANSWSSERDSISGMGDTRVLALRREELRAKERRLNAEAEGATALHFSRGEQPRGETSGFEEREISIFKVRLGTHQSQVKATRQTIALYENEIERLEAQISAEQKQLVATQRELDDLRGLASRGLAQTPRILQLERTIAQIEREQGELETRIIGARQRIVEAEQKTTMLDEQRHTEALMELQKVQFELREAAERYRVAQRMVTGAASSLLEARNTDGGDQLTVTYTIMRAEGEGASEVMGTETTPLEPGDILKVKMKYEIPAGGRQADGLGSAPVGMAQ